MMHCTDQPQMTHPQAMVCALATSPTLLAASTRTIYTCAALCTFTSCSSCKPPCALFAGTDYASVCEFCPQATSQLPHPPHLLPIHQLDLLKLGPWLFMLSPEAVSLQGVHGLTLPAPPCAAALEALPPHVLLLVLAMYQDMAGAACSCSHGSSLRVSSWQCGSQSHDDSTAGSR
jgi:hypothetical protein